MALCFECTGCGECCTTREEYAYVYLNDREVKQLARHLKLRVSVFKQRYTFIDEDGWRQLAFRADACIFLDSDTNKCCVYAARPIQCRTFPFWRDLVKRGHWTPQARLLCEGIGRGRDHPSERVEACMAEMERSEEG